MSEHPQSAGGLTAGLTELRDDLTALSLPLELQGTTPARTARREVIDQIDDYLLPRLANLEAPLLVVLGGSTGSGKSTLTNTLVGDDVTTAGVLRPTTRRPTLVCHPSDRDWFHGDGVLPDLPRVTGDATSGGDGLRLVTSDALVPGVALLDSPDIDSVEVANHDLAALLLGAADLWLFVTTAVRYADAVPWHYLRRAAERSVALALVVNRVPPGAAPEIIADLERLLDEEGLAGTRLFAVEEGDLGTDRDGGEAIGVWLRQLAADADERRALVRRTVDGLLDSLPVRIERVTAAVDRQADAARALGDAAERAYGAGVTAVDGELSEGVLLRQEVLDRFREHVGSGELMDRLQRGVGRFRDRLASIVTGRPAVDTELRHEVRSVLTPMIVRQADAAALASVEAWRSLPGGSDLLADAPPGLERAAAGFEQRVETEIDQWQQDVLALVQERAGSKVAMARGLSLGVNGVGVALMLAVFSQTGGVTGGEVAIAGGTAAAGQAVLSAVFGDQAVRDLVREAQMLLHERVEHLFAADRDRLTVVLDGLPDRSAADQAQQRASALASASW